MNYLIKISYDGSKFYGFQRLKNYNTVQKVLEDSLKVINKKEVLVKGAGRTDRGVHAYNQGVTFKLDINISCEGLRKALNSLVGPYIYVREVKEVDSNFHARFNVLKKSYIYKINLGEYDPLKVDYELQLEYKIDINKLKEVKDLYIGVHNFKNFVSGQRDNYECIIYDIDIRENNKKIEIEFIGKSFYRYMVRNLVGSMIEVARGKMNVEEVKKMLDLSIEKTSYTAPACGLYLNEVYY